MKRNRFITNCVALMTGAVGFGWIPKRKRPNPLAVGYRVDTFTPEMLKRHNFGLYIIKSTVEDVRTNPGYAATVAFKLGYHNHRIHAFEFKRYGYINFLTDGWFCPLGDDYEEVCAVLNEERQWRLMRKEEVLWLIEHRQQGFLQEGQL